MQCFNIIMLLMIYIFVLYVFVLRLLYGISCHMVIHIRWNRTSLPLITICRLSAPFSLFPCEKQTYNVELSQFMCTHTHHVHACAHCNKHQCSIDAAVDTGNAWRGFIFHRPRISTTSHTHCTRFRRLTFSTDS